ncbi:MAG: hypothetical protein MJZ92_05785, partial [Paludibacteraceae bacterium]|nr:hypothetical protein [Paludibacteraceae bacterium]
RPPAPKAGILTGLNYIPNAISHIAFRKSGAKVLHFSELRKYFLRFLAKICTFFFLYAPNQVLFAVLHLY